MSKSTKKVITQAQLKTKIKAKGTTVEAPRPTQGELEDKLIQVKNDVINLQWALKNATVRDALDELRFDMVQLQVILKGAADQLYHLGESEKVSDHDSCNLLALSFSLKFISDFMLKKITETDSIYMRELPGGKA